MMDETFHDWEAWERSHKGNRWLQRNLCKVTVFPSKYGDGWCWCVHWESRAQPVFSPAYPNEVAARHDAWLEVASGEAAAVGAWAASDRAWQAFEGLSEWQRRLALNRLGLLSSFRATEEKSAEEYEQLREALPVGSIAAR